MQVKGNEEKKIITVVRGEPPKPTDAADRIIRRYCQDCKEIDIRVSTKEINDLIKKHGAKKFDKYLLEKYPIPSPFRRTKRESTRTWPVKNPAAAVLKERSRSDSRMPRYVQESKGKKDAYQKAFDTANLQEQLRKHVLDGKTSRSKRTSPEVQDP